MLTYWDAMALYLEGRPHGPFPRVSSDEALRAWRPGDIIPIPVPGLPVPCPWLVEGIVSAVGVKQLAATLPDGPARTQMQKSADAAIAQTLEDYCGTPPRLVPWPWPGPPPWAYEIASELTTIAYTKQSDMRDALLAVAAQVLRLNPQPLPPGDNR